MVRKKHEKSKRGFKQTSDAFLNQVEILGGKGVIYTTPYSNGNYYFRTWIKDEKKYIDLNPKETTPINFQKATSLHVLSYIVIP